MIDMVKRFFGEKKTDKPNPAGSAHDVRVAVCALCIEIARIDNQFTREELDTLISVLKEKYRLSAEYAQALMTEADRELEESVDLWQFARLINEIIPLTRKSPLSKCCGKLSMSMEKWMNRSTI